MRTIMAAKSSGESSFSFSRRYFHWRRKSEEDAGQEGDEETQTSNSSSHVCERLKEYEVKIPPLPLKPVGEPKPKSKIQTLSVSKLRTALTHFTQSRPHSQATHLGTKVVGTLFGYRRGHVHFAFQRDPRSSPALLIELATPTASLVKEMSSGLVRIALECDRKNVKKSTLKLVEEPVWRAYCNGKKCGYGLKRECKSEEWIGKVLQAVEKVSMGAGVLPGDGCELGELMYMRAKFERVVGSRDSEAFYMMNPDGCGGPELSIYLLRV
uniref:Uncharacterized protein n=1 Tax=Kalanchoe fedtschenkoi TaxID=63787 RepID=A0A7N0UL92_KALFE